MINPLELMRNLENIKSQAEEFKKKLGTIKSTGYAMGNMIEVVVNGDMKVESLKIDPSLCKEGQSEMLEVFVASAINNAFENVKTRIAEEAKEMGGGLGLGL